MTEKCGDISDITLSPKFHSDNNTAVAEWKSDNVTDIVLSSEFNFDNNPAVTMHRSGNARLILKH
jgi:hypothetical protein